jgi:hypothetical protein
MWPHALVNETPLIKKYVLKLKVDVLNFSYSNDSASALVRVNEELLERKVAALV